jgi:PQQ-like domain
MILTLAFSALPTVLAHVPPRNIVTYSFISVSPNPIGVGQQVAVNFFVNIPPPTASAQYGDRWGNMTVKVTKPDGTTQTLGPFTSDATGGTYTTFTPTTTGIYNFQMFFGGQVLAGANLPPGTPPSDWVGDYFMPSQSGVYPLTVQEEQITAPPAVPLPTQYWTRPIYGENNEWYQLAGNWLGLGQSTFASTGMYNTTGNYNPYTKAPNTAHILWTKPEAFGGMIGGEYGNSQTANYYSTSQYEPKFAPIIMQGILYYTVYPGASTYPEGWAAVDLRTGKTIWTKTDAEVNNEVLRCGQIINMITPNQFGGLAYLWSIPSSGAGLFGSPTYMAMYDAMTGQWILNITGARAMTLISDDNGDLIGYYVNTTINFATGEVSASLSLWNATRCINLAVANYGGGAPVPDQWMWRPPFGQQLDFELGVQWSVPLPATDTAGNPLDYINTAFGFPLPSYYLGIAAVQSNVVLMTGADYADFAGLYVSGWMEEAGFSAIDGHLLWGPVNRTQVPYAIVYTGDVWSGSGAYVELTESTLSINGYSLTTGEKLWGPTTLPNASAFSTLGANAIVADGYIYIWLYGGDVYAYNILTGAMRWEYHTPAAGYESPYGRNSIWTFTVGSIADGKLFVPEGHMYSPPLFHKAQQLALNLTTGEVVWSIDAFDVTSAPGISDGVMVTLNAYDNQIYGYGKGPSKLTVATSGVGQVASTPVVISGTISDISAGSEQQAVAANFPNGLPCVSDESMTDWMKYVYMQQPFPTTVTGVPVTINVFDANNNYRTIGTTVSDGSGFFSLTWTPDIPGKYTVVALFDGSESYYPSNAEAAFFAMDASVATPQPTQGPASVADQYLLPATVGIIAAIVIVGAIVVLMNRRK